MCFYNNIDDAKIVRMEHNGNKGVTAQRYADPYDNLLYAILLQAALDARGDDMNDPRGEALKFLQGETAREWWRYLGTRPTTNEPRTLSTTRRDGIIQYNGRKLQ